jgi:hypothetical protein
MVEKSCANYYGQSRDSLSCQGPGAKIFLFKGDTREVLPKVVNTLPMMDFIFIDGGHSLETMENDWRYAQVVMGLNTFVVFDEPVAKPPCRDARGWPHHS